MLSVFSPEQFSQPNRHETTAKANFRSFRFNKLIFLRALGSGQQKTIRVRPQILTRKRILGVKSSRFMKSLIACQDSLASLDSCSCKSPIFSLNIPLSLSLENGKLDLSLRRQRDSLPEEDDGPILWETTTASTTMNEQTENSLTEMNDKRRREPCLVMISWIHSGSDCDE